VSTLDRLGSTSCRHRLTSDRRRVDIGSTSCRRPQPSPSDGYVAETLDGEKVPSQRVDMGSTSARIDMGSTSGRHRIGPTSGRHRTDIGPTSG
jgi:hypothetical protein